MVFRVLVEKFCELIWHITDVTDSKLKFSRFLFSLRINFAQFTLGKSPKFTNFCRLSEREQKWAHSCTMPSDDCRAAGFPKTIGLLESLRNQCRQ